MFFFFFFFLTRESVLGFFFFFQAEDGIRDADVTGVQTCALPILARAPSPSARTAAGSASLTSAGRTASASASTSTAGPEPSSPTSSPRPERSPGRPAHRRRAHHRPTVPGHLARDYPDLRHRLHLDPLREPPTMPRHTVHRSAPARAAPPLPPGAVLRRAYQGGPVADHGAATAPGPAPRAPRRHPMEPGPPQRLRPGDPAAQ